MFYPVIDVIIILIVGSIIGYYVCKLRWCHRLCDSDRVYNHAKCIDADEPDHPQFCSHCSDRFNAINEYRDSLL